MAMTAREVWKFCNGQEYLDIPTIEKFRRELPSNDGITIPIALGSFTPAICPTCHAEGYYRFHFLGRLQHPACGTSWYVLPGKYLAVQLKRTLHTGMDVATQDTKGNDSAAGKIGGFILGAWLRLCFGLLTAPIQAVVSLASRSKAKGSVKPDNGDKSVGPGGREH